MDLEVHMSVNQISLNILLGKSSNWACLAFKNSDSSSRVQLTELQVCTSDSII